MARAVEEGLEYIPMDVGIIHNRKLFNIACDLKPFERPIVHFAYNRLLLIIYSERFFIRFDDDDAKYIFHQHFEWFGLERDFFNRLINEYLRVGLFSIEMYEQHKVLTSRRIQTTWADAKVQMNDGNFDAIADKYAAYDLVDLKDYRASRKKGTRPTNTPRNGSAEVKPEIDYHGRR